MDNKIVKVTEKQKQLLDRNMNEIAVLKQQINIIQASTTDIITAILSSNGIDEEKNVRYGEGNIYIIEDEPVNAKKYTTKIILNGHAQAMYSDELWINTETDEPVKVCIKDDKLRDELYCKNVRVTIEQIE